MQRKRLRNYISIAKKNDAVKKNFHSDMRIRQADSPVERFQKKIIVNPHILLYYPGEKAAVKSIV